MPVIDNVVFFYTKIQQATKKYQSNDTEWSVDCAVDKATAKKWNKEFPKQKVKEIDNDEFLEKFKVEEVPFPEQEEQFVIKLKKAATRDGKATPDKFRPRVLEATAAGNVDVTFTKLVSNGSKGKASYVTNENDFGVFAQLSAILVEDLIEYQSTGGAGTEFGPVALAAVPATQAQKETQEEEQEEVPQKAPAKSSPKATPKPKVVEDESEESLF